MGIWEKPALIIEGKSFGNAFLKGRLRFVYVCQRVSRTHTRQSNLFIFCEIIDLNQPNQKAS
jgi:hypothetical protein